MRLDSRVCPITCKVGPRCTRSWQQMWQRQDWKPHRDSRFALYPLPAMRSSQVGYRAVGGKANLQPEMLMGEDYVSKLGQALNKVGGKSRFFRKTGQWLLALLRWSTIAIAIWQWSQVAMLTHVDTILHMAEKEVAKTGKLAASVAIFYCELRRRSWAERTRQG